MTDREQELLNDNKNLIDEIDNGQGNENDEIELVDVPEEKMSDAEKDSEYIESLRIRNLKNESKTIRKKKKMG